MSRVISIALHYQTNRKEKVEDFVQRMSKEYDLGFKLKSVERYHKFENQFRAQIELKVLFDGKSELVYFMLQLNNLFKHPNGEVTVQGPHSYTDELSFETILNQEIDGEPVKWIHMQLI